MAKCLIGLGANLGDRKATLERALDHLADAPGVCLCRGSRWHETHPIGGQAGQEPFLNGVGVVQTHRSAQDLLALLHRIETRLGRRRQQRWEPRPIDLDLLLYGRHVIGRAELIVPHPRMAWRRFVLEPASEIAGRMEHPTIGWTIQRLLDHVKLAEPYLAMVAPAGLPCSELAHRVAEACGASTIDDATFRSNSSGHATPVGIESIRRRAEAIRQAVSSPGHRTRWTVSDFWLPWVLAESESVAPTTRRAIGAKLLVVLSKAAGRLPRSLAEHVRREHVGPVLRLDWHAERPAAAQLDQWTAEVVAAIMSME